MPSVTTWNRLEPRARHIDFAESLAARVADPLWFLARQWQVGEFAGEDAGAAVAARLAGSAAPITRVRLGADGAAMPYDGTIPLEAVVEREPYRRAFPTARDAAEGGLVWLRMLDAAGLDTLQDDYVAHAPLAAEDPVADRGDPASERFRRVLGGRVPDGAALYAEFDAALRPEGGGPGSLPPEPDVGGDGPAVEAVARAWLEWWDAYAAEPEDGESAWVPSKFEYRFAIAAPADEGEVVLEAEEYPGGRLDWYSFRLGQAGPLGAAEDASRIRPVERTVTPSPVEIRGNPASRFWEFEDGRVDLARLEAGPSDLGRMLLAEFALIYGDDWLFVPVDLDVGSVFRTDVLEVTDTFGTVTAIPASTVLDETDERWGFFHLSDAPGPATAPRRPSPIFILPPVLATSRDGPPVEEVLLLRDEMANLAWGVERQIEGSRGRGIDRGEIYQRRRAAAPPGDVTGAEAAIRYRMQGRVPDYWIPLMPVRAPGSARSIRLQRGSVRDPDTGELHRPLGRILVPDQPLFVDEEEAPRAVLRVVRAPQYARWTAGETYLWMARKKGVGPRIGWSGLRFDEIRPVQEEPGELG